MRRAAAILLLTSTLALSACQYGGTQNLPLPGTPDVGDDPLTLTVELADVGTLVENAEVKIDDVAVGTVSDLRTEGWHAVAEIELPGSTHIPASTTAKVGHNSLLGAAYLELAPPPSTDATAVSADDLRDGDVIPLEQNGAYPSTEQVLAATSLVLNGSGLQQLRTVTTELNRALAATSGRSVRTLLPRLTSFIATLDDQKSDIVTALRGLNRLSRSFEKDIEVVDASLDDLEPGLHALSRQRTNLTTALTSLDELASTATAVVDGSREDLRANLEDLAPALASLNAANGAIVGGLHNLLTPPFNPTTVPNACRGDYCNLFLELDLSLAGLLENLGGNTNPGPGGNAAPNEPGSGAGGADPGGVLGGVLGGILGGIPGGVTGDTSPLQQLGLLRAQPTGSTPMEPGPHRNGPTPQGRSSR